MIRSYGCHQLAVTATVRSWLDHPEFTVTLRRPLR